MPRRGRRCDLDVAERCAPFQRELATNVYQDDLYEPWVDEGVLVASNVAPIDSGR